MIIDVRTFHNHNYVESGSITHTWDSRLSVISMLITKGDLFPYALLAHISASAPVVFIALPPGDGVAGGGVEGG